MFRSLRASASPRLQDGTPRRAIVLGAVIVCALAGCTQTRRARDDERIPVVLPADGAVRSVHPALSLMPDLARQLVAKALDDSGRFAVASPEEEGFAARLRVSVANARLDAADGPDGTEATVALDLQLAYRPPLSDDDSWLFVETTAVDARGIAAFESAIRAALVQLHERIRERARTDGELVADMHDADPERRRAALDELAGRRHPSAIPELMKLLNEADDTVAAGALTRLLAFDVPGLGRHIIDQAEVRGLAFLLQSIHALGAVGGDEAEAYLYVLESGHTDPRVLAAARFALESLERRGQAARPAVESAVAVEKTEAVENAGLGDVDDAR